MTHVEKDLLCAALEMGGACSLKAGGYCMSPVIGNGARVVVERVASPDELGVGDVIAYFIGTDLFVHRITGTEGGVILARGDRSKGAHRIARKEVLGRVRKVRNRSLVQRLTQRVRRRNGHHA